MAAPSFKALFIAIFIGTSLIIAALLVHRARPARELLQPTAAHVRAVGKCASCHRRETPAMVIQYEGSRHSAAGVTCLDCHAPRPGQEEMAHEGFVIASSLTAGNCAACHADQYAQYLRSRHAAPAWSAVWGPQDFTPEQIAFAEGVHPGAVDRPPHPLVTLEGEAAVASGCSSCHAIGKPNPDGSVGTCTACHARHQASVALARQPETCGHCHMGPDHAQIEIYHESKHGVLFNAQKASMNMSASPRTLTVADMSVPTCATCHMSGLEGAKVTHDVGERLSYWLFAPISEQRPHYMQARQEMQDICLACHTKSHVERFYAQAEKVLVDTNERVAAVTARVEALRARGLLTPAPFDEPIEFLYFDYWHYYGRTVKHGAFMGGADFVQWHGSYELLAKSVELDAMIEEILHAAGQVGDAQGDSHAGE